MADELAPSGLEQAASAAHPNVAPNAHAAGEAAHENPVAPKKPATTLESVVNETSHLFGNAVKLGLAGLIPYAQASIFPSTKIDTAVLAGAQVVGDATTSRKRGQKYTAGNTLESSLVGTVTTVPTELMFNVANKIPTSSLAGYATKAAYWGGVAYPAYLGLYQFVDYAIKNRTLKGFGAYLKKEYWPALKKSWKMVLPFSLLNVFFAPSYLQIPISAALQFVFTLFGAPKKDEVPEEKKRDKTPYLVAAPNAAYRLARNTYKGISESVYAMGGGISDFYKSLTKPGAAPAKAPSPAHTSPAPAH